MYQRDKIIEEMKEKEGKGKKEKALTGAKNST